MNSCNTDVFFSNYYHLLSVRFELPFTISLNRMFDYRLDAVKLRVTRQSIWRRWFVRAFLSTNGLHFAANARVTSPLSKDCHKRQDLEWR